MLMICVPIGPATYESRAKTTEERIRTRPRSLFSNFQGKWESDGNSPPGSALIVIRLIISTNCRSRQLLTRLRVEAVHPIPAEIGPAGRHRVYPKAVLFPTESAKPGRFGRSANLSTGLSTCHGDFVKAPQQWTFFVATVKVVT